MNAKESVPCPPQRLPEVLGRRDFVRSCSGTLLLSGLLHSTTAARGAGTQSHGCPVSGTSRLIVPGEGDCQVTALSAGGSVGFYEKQSDSAVHQKAFFDRAGETVTLPDLKGYRSLVPKGASAAGQVIGHAYQREISTTPRLAAFVWSQQTSETQRLPAGERPSLATDCSEDGVCVSGVIRGVPTIWTLGSGVWSAVALPFDDSTSKVLTADVRLSDNGLHAVASVAVDGRRFMGFVMWSRKDAGSPWEVHGIAPRGNLRDANNLSVRSVNDRMVVVGSYSRRHEPTIIRPFRHHPTEGFLDLGTLDDDTHGIATDVSNDDTALVYSDAYGVEGKGPRTFLWKDGMIRPLVFPDEDVRFHTGLCLGEDGSVGGHLARMEQDRSFAFVWKRDGA